MIALYFTIFEDEAKKYVHKMQKIYKEIKKEIKEKEAFENKKYKEIENYVSSLTDKEVRRMLINYMIDSEHHNYNNDDEDYYEYEAYYSEFMNEEPYYEKISNIFSVGAQPALLCFLQFG